METFYEELARVIGGKFSFRDGMLLAVDKPGQKAEFQASEYHEWIHIELTDNSAYGFFQKTISHYTQTSTLEREFRNRCSDLLRSSMEGCLLVHEGLASYRALVWYCSRQGPRQGEAYLRSLPAKYQEGVQMVFQLLRNPIEAPYDLLESIAIHFICGCIGTAALNSSILGFYSNFNNLSLAELPYLHTNTPDQRFLEIVEASSRSRPMLDWLMESAIEIALQTLPGEEADPAYLALRDEWLAKMDNLFSDMEVLNTEGWYPQAKDFLTNWSPYLEKLGQRFVLGEFGGFRSEESILAIKFRRLNDTLDAHQGKELDYHTFPALDEFIHYIEINSSNEVIWLLFVAFTDPDNRDDTHLDSQQVGVSAAPMLNHSPSKYSPLAGRIGFHCVANLKDWQSKSRSITKVGGVWYADGSFFRFTAENQFRFDGYAISKWESMKQLFDALDSYIKRSVNVSYGIFQWNDYLVAAIVSEGNLDFCISTAYQKEFFLKKVESLGLIIPKNYHVRIGRADVSLQSIARIALWAFVGN